MTAGTATIRQVARGGQGEEGWRVRRKRARPLRGSRLLCFGLQRLGYRPAVTGRTAPCKELFMQGEIDHLGSY